MLLWCSVRLMMMITRIFNYFLKLGVIFFSFFFSFSVFAIIYPPGYVDGDAQVTISDTILIRQVLAGLRPSNDPKFALAGFINGDINFDGAVQINDTSLARSALAGLVRLVTKIDPAIKTT